MILLYRNDSFVSKMVPSEIFQERRHIIIEVVVDIDWLRTCIIPKHHYRKHERIVVHLVICFGTFLVSNALDQRMANEKWNFHENRASFHMYHAPCV